MKARKKKAPGKYYRDGISLLDLFQLVPNEEVAEEWFIQARWPHGPICPKCGGNNIHERVGRKPQRFRCRSCKGYFSAKTGTALHASKITYQAWVIGMYLMNTNLKGVSSMRLHRELSLTQKSAWHMAHRLRKAWESGNRDKLFGSVEVDETYVGGKARNMHANLRYKAKGNANKSIVVGAKERATGNVRTAIVKDTSALTLGRFLNESVKPESTLYTDQNPSYAHHVEYKMDVDHFPVNHSVGEYVNGMAHTNGIESFWAVLKRGYMGTYHRMSKKHLGRYVDEFAGRHNQREQDTLTQMVQMGRGVDGKRLRYKDLVRKRAWELEEAA